MTDLSTASIQEICRLERDNVNWGDFSLMTDGVTVWLSEQASGFPVKQSIVMPRSVFNRLLAAYQKERRFVR